MPTVPAYTINGITRPELHLDNAGNIILDPVAAAFAATYGTKALYLGLPASTPYPPVAPSLTAPSDANGSANGVAEGAAAGTAVGITALATNTSGLPVTYSLTGDSSGGGFAINATTGVVTVANPARIDFESSPGHTYSITVQANDGSLATSQTFTIGVSDVAPSTPVDSNAAANTVAEGAANGTAVGVTVAATDVNGAAPSGLRYSLTGDSSNGGFTINSTTGVVTVANSSKIDFESSGGSYTITARASDGTLATTQTFAINVTDLAPSPQSPLAATAAEGSSTSTVVYQAAAVDPGGGTVTYSLSGGDSASFTINPSTGAVTFNAVPDFETQDSYTFDVVASAGVLSTPLTVTLHVSNVAPSAPADSNIAANTVAEGAANGTAVGVTAASSDPGGGPAVTYSLTDSAGGRFQIDANTGVVTVANGALLDYETSPGHAHNITVQATDGILTSSQTFSIGIGNVNEAPAGANNTIAAVEDTNYVFSAADFGFSDPSDSSAPNALASVRIATLPATGTLLNNGVAVNAGDFISAAAIAAGQLVFIAAANGSGAGYASFTFQVRDDGGTANGGVDTDQSPNTITINVNAVNDAPTATNLTQALVLNEDAAATTLFTAAPVLADIDSSLVTASLTLDAAAGVLIGAGAGVLAVGVLTYTITGTAAAVNAALAAVTFDSAPDFNGPANVGVTIDDGANGPQGANPTGTVSITVNAVNDAPGATNLTQSLVINEDAAATTLFSAAPVVSDIDSATVTATLTLDAAAGVLVGAGAGVLALGVLTYTITGTAAAVNAALAAVTYDPAPDFSGPANVGVTIDDGANGPQGANPTGAVSITVNAVNDAPTATNLTQSLSIAEDAAATTLFTLAPVISDVDSAAVTATLTLDATAGVLAGAGAGVLALGVLTYTITGTPAAVTAALAGVTFDSAPDFNGITSVSVTIDDGANGPQGANPLGTGSVTINAVNDAPTATNLTQPLVINEDAAATTLFSAAPVVADIDSSMVTASLTLDAAAGVLNGAGAGVLAAGVLTYTITGTAAVVNTALAAVTYDSADNFYGPTSVGVTIDDGANGPQGTNPTGTVSITVNAVNDAPTATDLTQSLTINEDAAATTLFTLAPLVADIDSATVTATLTLDAAAGVLIGAGAGALALGVLTYTITGTPAAVNAALAAVTFDSAPNYNGAASVGVTIDDGANGPQGGSNPAGTVNITLNAVNDAPTVAATANNPAYVPAVDLFSGVTASTVESGQVITQLGLTVSNVLGNDESLVIDGDTVALLDGTVSGAPTATLGVSYSVAVSGGTATITITSPGLTGTQTATLIDGLSYTNATVDPGELPRVVTIVSLTDDGGTALGGVATGTPGIASTVNFNVAPTITGSGPVNYTENDAATLIDPTITITDPDDTHMESATVVISSGYAGAQDVLSFTNTANITGSFVGDTLTATGHATLAEYETFLESVRYQNTSNDPSATDRIVSYTVNDGFVDSTAATATVHVAPRNDEPTLTATAANPGFTENGAAVDLFSGPTASTVETGQTLDQIVITVTNVVGTGATESLTIDGTVVELSNGNSEPTANGMTASVVLAAGTATVTVAGAGISAAAMATLVDNLAYGNTSEDPGAASRVVTVTSLRDDGANGGGNDNINATLAVSSTVAVTPVNDEPTLTTTGLNPGFTENGAAVDLFSTPVVASAIEASQNLNSLVLTVSNVAGTGATENLTIDGTIVELTNGNSEPTANGMTAAVTLSGGTATVTVSKAGGVSAAIMQSIVDGLAYDNTSEDPGAASRIVTLTSLSDTGPTGGANDNITALAIGSSVAVTPVNDAPVIDLDSLTGGAQTTATTATFSEGAGPPSTTVFVVPNLDLADVDNANLTGATVTVTDFVGGQDVLTVSGNTSGLIGGVNYSVSGNVITFSGTASVAAYETAIQAVQYNNSSENPAPGARHFDIQVTDGTDASTVATATVNVVGQDDAPVVTIPADAAVPTAFSNTDTAISGISIADVDAGLGTVTTQLSVTNGTVAVTLAGSASISAGASGTATLTLSGTVADINATLANNVTFHSTDGFTGQANLTVLTNDGGNSGLGGPLTDTEVVHIGVVPQVWYIDNTNFLANGAGGSGTVADPFRSIADFNDSVGPGANDYIVIRTGTGTYTGEGLDLQNGQQVWGAGETLSFTNPVNGAVVNIPNAGTRPTISVTGGDQGIDLASNNTIRNVNISTASGTTGLDDGSNDVGTLVIRNMDISGAGQAIDIDQGGALDVQLGTVSSSGGTFGMQLAGTSAVAGAGLLSGSFAATGGAISGSASVGFMVGNGAGGANTGGTAAISYGGTISTGAGVHVVNIQDHSTGAVTLSGNLTYSGGNGSAIVLDDNSSNFTFSGSALNFNTGSSNAINITNQTGGSTVGFSGTLNIDTTSGTGVNFGGTSAANVNFTGGNLTIDTTTGAGFVANATTNSTVNVTGTGNIINSISQTALNITSTVIGASNLNFQSISSGNNTAAADPVNGIILNSTGSSGGLIVTGTDSGDAGTTADTGTGGTIQNTSGDAIVLNNTRAVSLNGVTVTNATGGSWIDADNVTGLTLRNVNANNSFDHGIDGNNVTNLVIQEGTYQGGGTLNGIANINGINITNLLGTSSVTDATFERANTVQFRVNNNTATNFGGTPDTLTVSGTTWQNHNVSPFHGDHLSVSADTGGNFSLIVNNTDGVNTFKTAGIAVQAAGAGSGKMTADISGIVSGGTAASGNANTAGVAVIGTASSTVAFNVHDNTTLGTGSLGMTFNDFTSGSFSGTIQNNNITHIAGPGTDALQIVSHGDGNGTGTADGIATIAVLNNTIVGDFQRGIRAQVAFDQALLNLNISGNTVHGTDVSTSGGSPVALRAIEVEVGGSGGGTSDDMFLNLQNNNAWMDNGNAGYRLFHRAGYTFSLEDLTGSGTDPANITNWIDVVKGNNSNGGAATTLITGAANTFTSHATTPAPLLAAPGGVAGSSAGDNDLTQAELAPIIAAAIAQWADAGATAAQLAALSAIAFTVADLSGQAIGQHSPGHIVIDTDAAGHGWFVDATPLDNSEFAHAGNAAGTDLFADPAGAAAGQLDLLTAVAHEMGHELGMPDLTSAADANDLMYVNLVDGERRLPDAGDVPLASTAPLTPNIALGPLVMGTPGSDTLSAGQGGNILFGGAGADNFVFATLPASSSPPSPLTRVADYHFAEGDSFDFSALTSAFHGPGMSDAQIVRAVENASGTFATLQLNTTPDTPVVRDAPPGMPGVGANWVDVAQIDGVHAGDPVSVLIANGALHHAQIHVDLLV